MGKIDIDIDALDESISEFKTLHRNWVNNEIDCPTTVGGGGTVNQLEEIARIYEGLHIKMGVLLAGTISLLDNTKQDYVDSDQAIATKMKRESD